MTAWLPLANNSTATGRITGLANDPAQDGLPQRGLMKVKRTATSDKLGCHAAARAEARVRRDFANTRHPAGARSRPLADLRATVEASANSTDPVQSLTSARDALGKSQAFGTALAGAYSALAASKRNADQLPKAPKAAIASTATTTTAPTTATATPATTTASAASTTAAASASKRSQLNSIVSSGRSMAKQVISMGSGGNATQKENARLAKNYDKYLANVADSARGAETDREFDELIKKANQTKAYIVCLNKQSSARTGTADYLHSAL